MEGINHKIKLINRYADGYQYYTHFRASGLVIS
ncbi:hypothetical protein ACQV2R_06460 [Facklamia sp. P12937]